MSAIFNPASLSVFAPLRESERFMQTTLFDPLGKFEFIKQQKNSCVISPVSNPVIIIKIFAPTSACNVCDEANALRMFASQAKDPFVLPRYYFHDAKARFIVMGRLNKPLDDCDDGDFLLERFGESLGVGFGTFCAKTYQHRCSLYTDGHTGNYSLEDDDRKIGLMDLDSVKPFQAPEALVTIPLMESWTFGLSAGETFSRLTGLKLKLSIVDHYVQNEIHYLEEQKTIRRELIQGCAQSYSAFKECAKRSPHFIP